MKRTLAILLCILLLIPAFAVCASAAEPGQVYNALPTDDNGLWIIDGYLPKGVYNVILKTDLQEFRMNDFHNDYSYFDDSIRYSVLEFGFDGYYFLPSLNIYYEVPALDMECTVIGVSGFSAHNGNIVEAISFEYVGPLSSPGNIRFVESVKNTLNICIEWVGKVTTSLLSGELNGLLLLAAIPIAISVVLVTVKIIKKNSWGV